MDYKWGLLAYCLVIRSISTEDPDIPGLDQPIFTDTGYSQKLTSNKPTRTHNVSWQIPCTRHVRQKKKKLTLRRSRTKQGEAAASKDRIGLLTGCAIGMGGWWSAMPCCKGWNRIRCTGGGFDSETWNAAKVWFGRRSHVSSLIKLSAIQLFNYPRVADVVRVELGSGSFQPVDLDSALVPNRKSTNTIWCLICYACPVFYGLKRSSRNMWWCKRGLS